MELNNGMVKYYIASILLALFLIGMLFIGIGENQKVVEEGDTVLVDYTGKFLDGTVFDTSYPDIAISSGIYQPGRTYQPLRLIAGAGMVIEGFDSGILGMKEGEKKTLVIPPEQAYGPVDPTKIQVYPLIDDFPIEQTFTRTIEVPLFQFNTTFGTGYEVGDTVQLPDTNVNMTIRELGNTVNLSYNLKVGDIFYVGTLPWNETVIAVNSTSITVKHEVEVGDIIQFPDTPWNSTVIEVSETNITMRHNPIPDTTVQTMFGPLQIRFNETSIIIDRNNPMAGKTLVFDIEIVSIEKANTTAETEP